MKNKNTNKFVAGITIGIMLFSLFTPFLASAVIEEITKFAGTGAVIGESGHNWSNTEKISNDDDSYVKSQIQKTHFSKTLTATNFNFSIPLDATINGIKVTIGLKASEKDSLQDRSVRLIKNDSITGDNKAISTSWPTTKSAINYGSSDDLWGTDWTAEDINNINFGVALSVTNINTEHSRTTSIDYIKISISYTSDTIAPVLHLPDNITVDASDSSGAVVTFTAAADDTNPTHPEVTCIPPSGSIFSIGTTTVNCLTTDTAGNTSTGNFTITVNDTTTITWPTPADIQYGIALGSDQLNATASVSDGEVLIPGTFVYTPASGTILDIGYEQALHVNFTPTDTESYNSASKTVNINVLRADINVTADAKSKVIGSPDPTLTYSFTPGLVGEDSFSGALTREEGESVGTYAILKGTLSLNSEKYNLIYTGANLSIDSARRRSLAIGSEDSQNTGTTHTIITWFTNMLATSRVLYDIISHPALGEGANYGYANSTLQYDSDFKVSQHSVNLTGLNVGTAYYYRVISSASPEVVGSEKTFTTLNPPTVSTPTSTPAPSASGGSNGNSSDGNNSGNNGYNNSASNSSNGSGSTGNSPTNPSMPDNSIVINNGKEKTNSTSVVLTIAPTNNYQMTISNTPDFLGTSWENVATQRAWDLPNGDGLKTVFIKFRTLQGVVSTVYSDSILLDTAVPTPTPTPVYSFYPVPKPTPNPETNFESGNSVSGILPIPSPTPNPTEKPLAASPTPSPEPSNGPENNQDGKDGGNRSGLTASLFNLATLGTGNFWVSVLLLLITAGIIYYYRGKEQGKEK